MSPSRAFHEITSTSSAGRAPLACRTPELVGCANDLPRVLGGLGFGFVGAGSVGLNLSNHVSRLQPASMYFVDPASFKPASLLTHPISSDLIGKPKASAAARLAKDVSPGSRVYFFNGPVESLPATAFAGLDFVLLATDNLDVEIEVGQRCLRHRVPLLQASVHGSTLVAEVRFFANTDAQGPCPRCCFNAAELAYASTNAVFSCEGYYGNQAAAKATSQPTESFSFLCAIAADFCMTQVLRCVAKLGKPVHDRALQYCAYTDQIVVTPMERRADCPCDHQAWETATAPRVLADCTPGQLIRQAGLSDRELRTAVFSVDDLHFVESGSCRGCDHRQRIGQFVSSFRSVGTCSRCGDPIDADLYYAHRPAPIWLLADVVDRPLHASLATTPDSVLVSGERSMLFRNPADGESS